MHQFPGVTVQIAIVLGVIFLKSIYGDLFTQQYPGDCRHCQDNNPPSLKVNALTHVEENVIITSGLIISMSNNCVKNPQKSLWTVGPHYFTIQGSVCKRRKVFQYPLR